MQSGMWPAGSHGDYWLIKTPGIPFKARRIVFFFVGHREICEAGVRSPTYDGRNYSMLAIRIRRYTEHRYWLFSALLHRSFQFQINWNRKRSISHIVSCYMRPGFIRQVSLSTPRLSSCRARIAPRTYGGHFSWRGAWPSHDQTSPCLCSRRACPPRCRQCQR